MSIEKQRYTVLPRTLVFVFHNEQLLMMKYSGKGQNQTQEKADRKDIYNPLGGHIELGENVIENAIKETQEESGVRLENPKVKGIINVSGFSGKNVMMFIVTGTTQDTPINTTLEGTLEWVNVNDIESLNVFPDLKAILEKLLVLENEQIIVGTSEFDGKFGLLDITLNVV
jgi:8-oxo-dGTP diphosphatase